MNRQGGEGSILTRVAAKMEEARVALAKGEELLALKKREREAAISRDAQIRFEEGERVKRALSHLDDTAATDVYGNPIVDPGEPDHPSLAMNHNQTSAELSSSVKSERPPFYGFGITSLTPKPVNVEPQEFDQRVLQLKENKKQ